MSNSCFYDVCVFVRVRVSVFDAFLCFYTVSQKRPTWYIFHIFAK